MNELSLTTEHAKEPTAPEAVSSPLKPQLALNPKVKFVDRTSNQPLYTMHHYERPDFEDDSTERTDGSCTCLLF